VVTGLLGQHDRRIDVPDLLEMSGGFHALNSGIRDSGCGIRKTPVPLSTNLDSV
jgi:hypothetical protein